MTSPASRARDPAGLDRRVALSLAQRPYPSHRARREETLALQEYEKFDSEAQGKKNVVRAIEAVAEKLGNTPSICRKCYVHPAVIESYLDGSMLDALRQRGMNW
jgi:DNA topoisomerase IB